MHGQATLSMLILIARSPVIEQKTRAEASLLVFKIDQAVWRLNLLGLNLPIFEPLFPGCDRASIFDDVIADRSPRSVH